MHPSTQRVIEAARAMGLELAVKEFAEGTRTAQDAADAIGCQVGQIVKSLCFVVDERPTMVLVSGDNQLDEKKLAALCHVGRKKVKRADADEVKAATGYSIGGVSPFGHATQMQLFMDEDLLQYAEIWAAAGTPHAVFPIAPPQLQEKTGATVADVKKEG